MTAEQIVHQAREFHRYREARGLEWDLALVRFADMKHLEHEDYLALRQAVHLDLVARGELALTDLPDWAGDAGDDADEDSAGNARAA